MATKDVTWLFYILKQLGSSCTRAALSHSHCVPRTHNAFRTLQTLGKILTCRLKVMFYYIMLTYSSSDQHSHIIFNMLWRRGPQRQRCLVIIQPHRVPGANKMKRSEATALWRWGIAGGGVAQALIAGEQHERTLCLQKGQIVYHWSQNANRADTPKGRFDNSTFGSIPSISLQIPPQATHISTEKLAPNILSLDSA